MPINLGAFGGGAVQGFDTAQGWKDRAAQRQRQTFMFESEKAAQDALKAADAAWGKTVSSMTPGGGGPMPQSPMPGQPSQPMGPPPSPPGGQVPIGPHSFANQPGLSQGVSAPPGMQGAPPPIGQNVAPPQGTPPIPQQPMHPPPGMQGGPPPPGPLAAQPYRGPAPGAPPPPQMAQPPGGQGGPPPMGGMQPGSMDLNTVTQQVLRANPDLNPKNPRDAMIIARAVGNALPYMKQDDAAQYHQMVSELRQQRQDTQEEQGNKRIDIAQQRADQGWQRVQQASERLMTAAQAKKDNLAVNMERLEVAKKSGDTQRQRLIMDQIKNDRAARDQTVNAIANLLRSASPSQLNDPVFKADIEALHAQMKEIQQDPSSGVPSDQEKKSTRSEDAAIPKASVSPTAPKAGAEESGYRFKGGDPSDPKNWVPSAPRVNIGD